VGPYNRFEREIYTKERESVSLVQRRKRGNEEVYSEADEKGVYLTIKVITDCTGASCRK